VPRDDFGVALGYQVPQEDEPLGRDHPPAAAFAWGTSLKY
jgi:hypothetical protein